MIKITPNKEQKKIGMQFTSLLTSLLQRYLPPQVNRSLLDQCLKIIPHYNPSAYLDPLPPPEKKYKCMWLKH